MTWDVFTVSVVASVIATIVVFVVQRLVNIGTNYKSFRKFNGAYENHTYGSEDPESSDYNMSEKGDATVNIKSRFLSPKRIDITHTEGNETWKGLIYMKNKNVGDLSWKYEKDPLRIGSKEVSFWEKGSEKIIYINERFDKKYGREVFIKKERNGV